MPNSPGQRTGSQGGKLRALGGLPGEAEAAPPGALPTASVLSSPVNRSSCHTLSPKPVWLFQKGPALDDDEVSTEEAKRRMSRGRGEST